MRFVFLLSLLLASTAHAQNPSEYASEYAKDTACASCHEEIYSSYQEVAMARSFYRPSPDNVIEDFDNNHFYHEPTKRHYEMRWDDGRLLFKRWQVDAQGEEVNVFEHQVDWILGSGYHSRTYLFGTPSGELFELPLAWYTESGWNMAPGFEGPDHKGVTREVRRECMFCHNAYPRDVPPGSDAHGAPQVFPEELPEGLGCQRCHGPGARHVELGLTEMFDVHRVRSAVLNPADLTPELREDICSSCHLQPAVALFGPRRFGVGDYSFRPGQPLSEYMVVMDVDEEGTPRSERFEINHHPYRLRQSRCFTESGGQLTCLTCHDPHRKVKPEERAAHYRKACLGCHEVDACRLDEMASEVPHAEGIAPDDCVACHMQERRPRDVIHTVMTDHFIRRRPGGPELVAPREKEPAPVLLEAEPYFPESAPRGDLGEIYRAVAVMRTGGSLAALKHLDRKLRQVKPPEPEPYLDLAEGQIRRGLFQAAKITLEDHVGRFPDDLLAREWLAVSRSRLGETDEGIEMLRAVTEKLPRRADSFYNLGLLVSGKGALEEATVHLERAVELNPVLEAAWFHLGRVREDLGLVDEAKEAYLRALAVDPRHERAYLALGEMMLRQGDRREAERIWRHGALNARDPRVLLRPLEQLQEELEP